MKHHYLLQPGDCVVVTASDASTLTYLESLERQVEALKYCGSCRHIMRSSMDMRCYAYTPYEPVYLDQRRCRFSPSLWEEREVKP